ncbi:MFS transporter [Sphingobium sp. AN558]|uniref:MFS transporter n=1 Tax=Sphingobium sp. AN558 TaxID=3133442 RepID=UPI0030C5E8CB
MAAAPVRAPLKLAPYISLVGAGVLIFTGLFSLAPSLPALRQHFIALPNIDVLVQIVGAGAAFTFAIGCLLSGRLIERAGYRSIYVGSLLTMGVAGTSAALIDNIYLIILTRAIVGFAVAGIVNSVLVAINRLLNEQAEARALGLQGAIGSVMAIGLFPIMGFLTSVDWRLAFSAHLIAFLFLPLALMLPVAASGEEHGEPGDFASAVRNVGALVGASAVFSGIVIFALAMFGPLFVLSLGVTDPQMQSLPPTATVIGSALGSWLTIPLRARFTLSRLLALTLFVEFMGLAVIALSFSFPGVIAGTLLGGLGTGLVAPILYACVIKASTGNPASGLGLMNALIYGAMILFPLVAMPLAQLVGSPRLMLMTLVGCGLLLMILLLLRTWHSGLPGRPVE